MSDFTLNIGGIEIVALSDMNLPFPMPLTQLLKASRSGGGGVGAIQGAIPRRL